MTVCEQAVLIPHSCPDLGPAEVQAARECLESLYVKGGPRVAELEATIASDQGYQGGIAVTTGSHAIHLALRVCFKGQPAVVGLPTYLCRTAYDAVLLAGCRPCLLDIDPGYLSVSTEAFERTPLDAVIIPHMFGIRAPIERFLDRGVLVIEDCAQRLTLPTAAIRESHAPIRIVSLEATKLVCAGEGGVLLSDDLDLLHRARHLRDGTYDSPEPALLLPMTDLQAAVALAQWRRLEDMLSRRRAIAATYLRALTSDHGDHVIGAMTAPDTCHARFLLWTSDPDRFIQQAAETGFCARRPVRLPLHRLLAVDAGFPVAEAVYSRLVSIPIHPGVSDSQVRLIIDGVQRILGRPGDAG